MWARGPDSTGAFPTPFLLRCFHVGPNSSRVRIGYPTVARHLLAIYCSCLLPPSLPHTFSRSSFFTVCVCFYLAGQGHLEVAVCVPVESVAAEVAIAGIQSSFVERRMMMKVLTILKHRARARLELARARMQLRNICDYEIIGRYCGLLIFPFIVYVCVGQMQGYSESQIRNRIATRKDLP
ncbi:hypothetical protein, conserved [Leishmania tarentolae]|uniref:Uncharacterized protein n=1 Tax=Leishmania tarentolae TaxID=5689 RepID=A0A640KM63_LEITA|nr:hypothetical protein, conserved [Leishmania tarentolae]